jgi:rod shape determining protein RodA
MTQLQPKPAKFDWLTLMLYYVFVVAGLLSFTPLYHRSNPMIYDNSMNYGKQLVWMGISFFVGLMILLIDEKFFYAFAYGLYGISIVMLLSVFALGTEIKGSSSWIP